MDRDGIHAQVLDSGTEHRLTNCFLCIVIRILIIKKQSFDSDFGISALSRAGYFSAAMLCSFEFRYFFSLPSFFSQYRIDSVNKDFTPGVSSRKSFILN